MRAVLRLHRPRIDPLVPPSSSTRASLSWELHLFAAQCHRNAAVRQRSKNECVRSIRTQRPISSAVALAYVTLFGEALAAGL